MRKARWGAWPEQVRGRRARFAPRVEALEDRTVPSTYTVNTNADTVDANPGDDKALDAGGLTSLRAAVMEANAHPGADTIVLPADTYRLTIAAGKGADDTSGDLD